jgi:hypothetical protein
MKMPVINTKDIDFCVGTIIRYNKKAVEWAKKNNPPFSTIIGAMLDYKFLVKNLRNKGKFIEMDVSVYPEGQIFYTWKLSKLGTGTECPFPIFIRSKKQ